MKKVTKILITLLALTPVLAGAHYVAGDAIHTGDEDISFVSGLHVGSRGAEVTALQTYLSGRLDLYPEGLITGYFGHLTEKAVKKLQAENGLEQVGLVGPRTRVLLNRLLKEAREQGSQVKLVPQIIDVFATSTTPNHGYVFWTSNKFTTSEFWYSTTTPVNPITAPKISDTSKSLSHSTNLDGLATSTTYYYMIKVFDEKGLSATSTERVLQTLSQ